MLRLRLCWFQELGDSVLDFRAVTTVIRGTLIIIPMGTLDTRMSTIIRMPEIRTHIIPLHQPTDTADIGLTTGSIGIIAASSPDQRF